MIAEHACLRGRTPRANPLGAGPTRADATQSHTHIPSRAVNP
jgi:hypothetical protein